MLRWFGRYKRLHLVFALLQLVEEGGSVDCLVGQLSHALGQYACSGGCHTVALEREVVLLDLLEAGLHRFRCLRYIPSVHVLVPAHFMFVNIRDR